MKIDRITYTHTYQIGLSQWQKIGMEGTVIDGEYIQDALGYLKEQVESFHRKSNPSLYPKGNEPIVSEFIPEVQVNKTPEERKIAVMIKDMQSVTDLKVLQTYEFLAKKFPEIKEAYDKKLQSLQK